MGLWLAIWQAGAICLPVSLLCQKCWFVTDYTPCGAVSLSVNDSGQQILGFEFTKSFSRNALPGK
jgi:hypothetical protein